LRHVDDALAEYARPYPLIERAVLLQQRRPNGPQSDGGAAA
jgi:hypothetical protein